MNRRILQIFLFFIVVFVFASGARRASAGTYELTCDHWVVGNEGTLCYFFSDESTLPNTHYTDYGNPYPDTSSVINDVSGSFSPNNIGVNSGSYDWTLFTSGSDFYYFIYNQDWGDLSTSTTRFSSIYVSTTTQTWTVTGYIGVEDFASTTVRIGMNVATPLYTQWDNEQFIATTSGAFSYTAIYQNFSTSTTQSFTFTGTLYSYVGNIFESATAVHKYDEITHTTSELGGITDTLHPTDVVSGTSESCNIMNPFTFQMSDCLSYLFYPSRVQVEKNIVDLRDNFLEVWPLGYVTRFVDIVTETATSSLPSISYTSASNSMFGEMTFEFDPFGALQDPNSPMNFTSDQDDPQTIWEIMQYPTYVVVYLMLLFMIVHDITGVAKHRSGHKNL